MHYASIAIPARVFHPFLYRIPQNMTLTPGMRVVVPFRKRSVIGFVLELTDQLPKTIKEQSLKSVETLFDEKPVLSPALLELMQWMARYYCAPIGEVCRTMLPKRLLEIAPVLSSGRVTSPHEIAHEMQTETIPTLTEEQARALDFILKEQKKERQLRQLPILLHGITGSGKTEIYLRLIHELQTQGGDTILLVPEIGLTPQLALRVVERFGDRVAIYHSGLTDAQRFSQWKRMQNDEVDVVVGTRSALFAPLPHLQAIIVDEEHDSSYKQEEGFLYHARDVAIVRAAKENILVILGSATPSMETFANAKKGKYHYLELKKRATGASLPPVEIIDMRSSQRNGNSFQGSVSLSEKLGIEIQKRLERKEQTLLFLNRRGFSNFLLCESCGAVPKCPNCDISLTVHLKKKKLLCHYCDYALSLVKSCSECKTENLLPVGAGTERLEEELHDFFPEARIARLDRDTVLKKESRSKFLKQMREGKIDILLGTQMVTKGHDFPNVTLVGIIHADTALCLPDFRAAERTFQLITQVAGRAGRDQKPGTVIIQTYHPQHHSLLHAQEHDFHRFFLTEETHREELGYPPFLRLANIRFSGINAKRVEEGAHNVARFFQKNISSTAAFRLLGPAVSPLERVRGKYRWQLLLKASSSQLLGKLLHDAHERLTPLLPSGVRLTIDVDPLNLL